MRTRSKVTLAAAVVLLAAGLFISTHFVREPKLAALYVVLPLGAVLFGLFLTFRLLDQESARYDQEIAKAQDAADPEHLKH